jgi:alpha-mannosidase
MRRSRGVPVVAALAASLALLAVAPTAGGREPARPLDQTLAKLDAISNTVLDGGWRADGKGWFARWVVVPGAVGGYDVTGMRAWLSLRIESDAPVPLAVYVDGHKAAEVDDARLLEPVILMTEAVPGRRLLIRVKAGLSDPSWFIRESRLAFDRGGADDDPHDLLQDLAVAKAMLAAPDAPSGGPRIVEAALAALDFGALARGDRAAFDRGITAARERLHPLGVWMRRMRVIATARSHIDMAFRKPWSETVEVARHTFATVLDLMDQYPDLVYAQPSAQAYAWMEEKYPALFQQIRERVREGRWEPVGGMWAEPDLDLADGESLVRQLLLGQRYFIDKLGRPARIGWSPDAFQGSWQLPQLYRNAGIDTFVTQRLPAEGAALFPHRLFWWEAPNGTRLLGYLAGDGDIDGPALAADVAAQLGVTPFPELLRLYDIGDHGPGPARVAIDGAQRLGASAALFPRLDTAPARGFFDHVLGAAEGGLTLPVWRDELYAGGRRGSYTTDGASKQANRRSEALLQAAERMASLATMFGEPYPRDELGEAWRRTLLNQERDILAGTGIASVRLDAARDQAEVRRLAEPARQRALEALAARTDTRGAGTPVVVANPLAWARTELVEVQLPSIASGSGVVVTAPGGAPVPAELAGRDKDRHAARVRFLATEVPGLGLAVYHVQEIPRPRLAPMAVREETGVLENEHLRVTVDPLTGCITSLYEKRGRNELVPPGGCANALQAFADQPADHDALALDPDYEKAPVAFDGTVEVRLVEGGPLRATVEVVRRLKTSRFTQRISLDAGATRVEIATDADWHERHVLVKAAFPTTVASDVATYEIPYGTIERPTTRRTPEERARFEVPALRWGDLSDAHHGLTLINDGRAGYDARAGIMRLTLLRGPTWPDPHVDEGRQRFTYALVPHAGDWRQSEAIRRGYELGQPLVATVAAAHPGTFPSRHAFVRVTPDAVVLSAVKAAEDDDGLILRLYETAGETVTTEVHMASPIASAEEVDLLEHRRRPLPVRDGSVAVQLGPYEIGSIRIRLAKR